MADKTDGDCCTAGGGFVGALLSYTLAAACGGGYSGGFFSPDFLVYSRPLTQL